MLKATQLGHAVNAVRKCPTASASLVMKATELRDKWKEMVKVSGSDGGKKKAVGAAPHENDDMVPTLLDNAAVGAGGRLTQVSKVDDGSSSGGGSSSSSGGGGGGGGGAKATRLTPTPTHTAVTVDYVGFYKRKVPNADRRFKNFCNLYTAPYVVPADGTGNAISLLPAICGMQFQTVEGGYQLLKFIPANLTGDDIKLFAKNSGAVAFFLGSSNASMFAANMNKKSNPELYTKMLAFKARKLPVREDWDIIKVDIMQDFMTYKYTQNKKLKKLLLSTGSKPIVERSPTDAIWGDGNQHKPELGPGTNLAGKLLVKIRDSIRRGATIV